MDKIIITSNSNKKFYLRRNTLENVTIYGRNEFLDKYYYPLTIDILVYLKDKYHLSIDIIKEYFSYLYFINEDSDNEKIHYLYLMKQDLLDKGLIKDNGLFRKRVANSEIYLDSLIGSDYEYFKEILNAIIIDNNSNIFKHDVVHFENINDEVSFLMEEIGKLLNQGIKYQNIYVVSSSEYDDLLLINAKIYGININYNGSLYDLSIIKNYLNNMEDYDLDSLKEYPDIHNKMVGILNKYIKYDIILIKDILIDELKHTSYQDSLIDGINLVDINYPFSDNDYVFLLGFNEENYPKIEKDVKYLGTKEREVLGLSSLRKINFYNREMIKKRINNIKNLVISYKDLKDKDVYFKSSIIDDLGLIINEGKLSYNISNIGNKINYIKYLDKYYKYRSISDELKVLNYNYQGIYDSFNHQYSFINNLKLDHLNLSYSTLNLYTHCSFKYYLNNIIGLDNHEFNFSSYVGSLFHYVLEKALDLTIDIDKRYQEYIDNNPVDLKNSEKYYLEKLKKDIKIIIDDIRNKEALTSLNEEEHELNVRIMFKRDIPVYFNGYIDKVKYNEELKTLAIIDYKTGEVPLDLTYLKDGINLQLPIYLYLLKKTNYGEYKIAGIYLQRILNGIINNDSKKSYIKQYTDNLKLFGYSNKDQSVLGNFDHFYVDSSMIKSMRVKNDGTYYNYAKVLSNEEFKEIVDEVDKIINNTIDHILKADFMINPKKVGKDNECLYCPYHAICFKDGRDVIKLKEVDSDGLDEGTNTSDREDWN